MGVLRLRLLQTLVKLSAGRPTKMQLKVAGLFEGSRTPPAHIKQDFS